MSPFQGCDRAIPAAPARIPPGADLSDAFGDACENCALVSNPLQTDFDHRGEGDHCDLDDGLI